MNKPHPGSKSSGKNLYYMKDRNITAKTVITSPHGDSIETNTI